jgi:RNA polymerase sigma-70 factor (family 1)
MSREGEFERLFRECYAQLYAFAIGLVREDELCRDILSDSFEILWNHLDEIDEARQKSYLYRTVRNKCTDWARSRLSQQRYEIFFKTIYGDENDDDGTMLKETEDNIDKIYQLMDTLTPQTRRILDECYFKGRRQADVAEELGISVSAVKKHIAQAMKVFKSNLNLKKAK